VAIDTAAKRAYAIGVGLPVPTVYDEPDGTIGAEDRGNIAWGYYMAITVYLTVLANVFGNLTPTASVEGQLSGSFEVEGV